MTRIYYFSGTGNSLWSAKKIMEIIGGDCELVNIGSEIEKDVITLQADAVVLLFPSYGFGLPLVVSRFIQKTEFNTAYIAALVTYGSHPGGTLAAAGRLLKRKNIKSVFFGRIPAVENYIPLFGPQKEKTIQKRLALQREATEKIANCIAQRRTNRINLFRPFSAFVWLLFTLGLRIFFKRYRVANTCDGCGICEKICPVAAITMKNDEPRPVFSAKCEHCQGCFNWCPRNAINFGRLKPGARRYHHPEINLADFSSL